MSHRPPEELFRLGLWDGLEVGYVSQRAKGRLPKSAPSSVRLEGVRGKLLTPEEECISDQDLPHSVLDVESASWGVVNIRQS